MSNSPNPSPAQSNQSPSPAPTPTPSPLSQQEMQELLSLRREKAALSAMLWELVRQAAPDTHSVEVPPAASDPLWQLAFVKSSNAESGKVRILAGTIKPIAEQEKKRVVRLLRGTSTPMHTALAELDLQHFPPSYVEREIGAHLKWSPAEKSFGAPATAGVWESVTPQPFGEKAKNFFGIAKS